ALAAAEEGEHQQVEPLGTAWLVAGWDDRLEEEQTGTRGCCCMDGAQDRCGSLVVPVVEDCRQDVDVAFRNALEEAALLELDPLAECVLVAHGLGQVEDDPAETGLSAQHLDQERAVSAPDVDHRLIAAPINAVEPLDPLLLALLH